MINRLRKYEEVVMRAKGHRHLYDPFEKLVGDLRNLKEWNNALTQGVTGVVQMLLYEAAVTAFTPFYPLYSYRCWHCADVLHDLLREKDRTIRPDTLIREIEDLLIQKRVMNYTEESVWSAYINRLMQQERWHDIRTLITHSIVLADEGGRPRDFQRELTLYNHLKRAITLIHRYIRQTGDHTALSVWTDACNLKHHQNILYNLINQNGDIRTIGLLIHSIESIEQLQTL